MAGRGRGRGSAFSYTAEVLGLGRGADAIPASVLQPPPPFPPLQFKPVPLASEESYEYMLLLKQEFRGSMRDSPYFVKPLDKKKDIERYSDKYQSQVNDNQWVPNWKYLPKELNYLRKTRTPSKKRDVKPKVPSKSTEKEIVKTLETLEKQEEDNKQDQQKAAENKNEESGTDEEEVEYSEDDEEEGNDYLASYFDPGEDYLDEDNGADEGPTY